MCCYRNSRSATVGILGLAYKENTHSTKNSPSLALIAHLATLADQSLRPGCTVLDGAAPGGNRRDSRA